MKKGLKSSVCLLMLWGFATCHIQAEDWQLTPPDMSPRLVYPTRQAATLLTSGTEQAAHTTADAPKALSPRPSYKFFDDVTWAGVPIFLAGIIAKNEKEGFRQNYDDLHANTRLVTHFESQIDNYTQYFGPALTLGLKVAGVEGRSSWGRLAASSAMSYAAMALMVNSIKYTAKEMRPDGSTRNSWPSGHTATAFTGATILHKEYGLTRSNWYSVAGFSVATATGVMRVLNNRHWVSDVLSGAGIGIIAGELGYALGDLFFKDKGLLRGSLTNRPDLARERPSFFDVSMGIGLGSNTLDFRGKVPMTNSTEDFRLMFRAATVVGVEGAYFLNRHVGLGGRLRVRTSTIGGWERLKEAAQNETHDLANSLDVLRDAMEQGHLQTVASDIVTGRTLSVESDHLTEFSSDMGLYFHIPLCDRLAIGAKALVGRSVMQSLNIGARYTGNRKVANYRLEMENNQLTSLEIKDFRSTGDTYDIEWDYLTVTGGNSTKYGTGVSLTYAYKHNYCWKVFLDYDYTLKDYTMTYDPDRYLTEAIPSALSLATIKGNPPVPTVSNISKHMHTLVLGGAFSISF